MEQDPTSRTRCGAKEAFSIECSAFVAEGFRKYCSEHSRLASRLWKRRERLQGGSYHGDWKERDKAKAAAYAKIWRQRRKTVANDAAVGPSRRAVAVKA